MLDIFKHVKQHNSNFDFIIENVKMKQEFEQYMTEQIESAIGKVHKQLINSALLSAQNRERYYWTSKPIPQPQDKNILLKDIILDLDGTRPCTLRTNFTGTGICHHIANTADIKGIESMRRVYAVTGKAPTLTTMSGGNRQPKIYTGNNCYKPLTPLECERLQTLPDNYTSSVSNTQRYKTIGNGWTVDIIAHILKHLYNLSHK